jgi:hypothetical protein
MQIETQRLKNKVFKTQGLKMCLTLILALFPHFCSNVELFIPPLIYPYFAFVAIKPFQFHPS